MIFRLSIGPLLIVLLFLEVSCSKPSASRQTAGAGTESSEDAGQSQQAGGEEHSSEESKADHSEQGDSEQGDSEQVDSEQADSGKGHVSGGADPVATAEERLKKINSDYVAAVQKLNQQMEGLATEQEKAELFGRLNPEPEYTRQLFRLVQAFPATDSAFTAGMTIILEYPTNKEFPDAMDLILEHHGSRVEWQKIAGGYLELVPSLQIENWMRKMIEKAGNDKVKVQMTYLLYRYFDQFPTFASTLEYNPEVKQRFAKDRIDYIYNRKQVVREEFLATLKELKEKYPEVEAEGNRKLKDVIDGPIFELEHLQVGSVAPDIVGTDFDGIEFRLSDYRGKVVMLDFWGQWCPPCRAMFPHERELIEQLVGKPFVLIGVNSDRRLETAIKATREENLVWRNFWCGPEGRTGPIAKKWNVSAWPTVYLIDAEGIIRYKEVLGKEIDNGIVALLTEMGHPVSLASRNTDTTKPTAAKEIQSRLQQVLVLQDRNQ